MSDEVLVKVEGVSKKYCRSLKRSLWYGVQDVTSEMLGQSGHHNKLRKNEFWAVKDVSLKLRRGECLGLIGPNGAGKSTLLKMLNGLVKPDMGRITMRGRVGALIELNAGFNPILTARENIYVNGSVLGFSKAEIDRKFDAIVDFAEMEEFIDTPVQSFSSGMKVRLGFSVAAQMEPDVFLIDEVLAVGDYSFRTKCLNYLSRMLQSAALIFVSHSMPLVANISSGVMLLNRGKQVHTDKSVPETILSYLNQTSSELHNLIAKEGVKLISARVNEIKISEFPAAIKVTQLAPITISFTLDIQAEEEKLTVSVAFFDYDDRLVAEARSDDFGCHIRTCDGTVEVTLELESLQLTVGKYSIQLSIAGQPPDRKRGEVYLQHKGVINMEVAGNATNYAPVIFPGNWVIK